MRYVLLISYDGTAYGGWQIQNNSVTVQEKLTDALEEVLGYRVNITASGRTDSGVHAAAQVCHFDAQTTIPPERFADALNPRLPQDISVLKSCAAPDGFDASRSAKRKTYCYRVYLSERRNPMKDRYSAQVKFGIDMQRLERACNIFEGEHDFAAYCAAGSQVKTTVRRIYSIELRSRSYRGSTDLEVYVTGNGFLYNMVRTLVGTLLYYAAGRLGDGEIERSLTEGDRGAVGKTMPAHGLTLESVDYGFGLFGGTI